VTEVDVVLGKDLIHVRYEPSKLAPEKIVETVRKQGFPVAIVPDKESGSNK
jgi:hypothetical protein